jgi:hypothetical protein
MFHTHTEPQAKYRQELHIRFKRMYRLHALFLIDDVLGSKFCVHLLRTLSALDIPMFSVGLKCNCTSYGCQSAVNAFHGEVDVPGLTYA